MLHKFDCDIVNLLNLYNKIEKKIIYNIYFHNIYNRPSERLGIREIWSILTRLTPNINFHPLPPFSICNIIQKGKSMYKIGGLDQYSHKTKKKWQKGKTRNGYGNLKLCNPCLSLAKSTDSERHSLIPSSGNQVVAVKSCPKKAIV